MKTTRWAVVLALVIAACGTEEPNNSGPDQTPTGVLDPVQDPREQAVIPEPSAPVEPSEMPAASPTEELTPTPEPTDEPTPSPTPTKSPTPTPSPTASPSPSPSPSKSPSPSPSPSKSPSPSPSPSKSPSPSPSPSKSPSPSPSPSGYSVSYADDVVPILQTRCASCHRSGGMGSDAITMFTSAGAPIYNTIRGNMDDMLTEIEAERMPMNAPGSVTDDEIEAMTTWLEDGAPNN